MDTDFIPDETNGRLLRDAFSKFASGVTVVTAMSEEGPVGITANSFSSLSIDPPLVIWSPSVGSRRFPYFENAEYFAIHVLAADQEEICFDFAKSPFAFEALEPEFNAQNVPLLKGCLARFECRKHDVHPGGDHVIVVGQIERVSMQDGAALAFFSGQFRALDPN